MSTAPAASPENTGPAQQTQHIPVAQGLAVAKCSSGSSAGFWVVHSPGGVRSLCLYHPGPSGLVIAGHLPGMLHQSFPSLDRPLCAFLYDSSCASSASPCLGGQHLMPKEHHQFTPPATLFSSRPLPDLRSLFAAFILCPLHLSSLLPLIFLSLPSSHFSPAPISPTLRRREIEGSCPLYAPSVARRTPPRRRIQFFVLPRPMSDVSAAGFPQGSLLVTSRHMALSLTGERTTHEYIMP